MPPPRFARLAASCTLTLLFAPLPGCQRAPPEPEREGPPVLPAARPLPSWEAPPTWTRLDVKKGGTQKAGYRIPSAGGDKESAELTVHYHGSGSKGVAETVFAEWFDEFDGDPGKTAPRTNETVGAHPVTWVEFGGTYRGALGPRVGKKKQPAVAIIKEGWKTLGAAVNLPDGNYFFKITGPKDTVNSARPALRALLETVRPAEPG